MAVKGYQMDCMAIIDKAEEVKNQMNNLITDSTDDITFVRNEDGSIKCSINYKGYDVVFRLTEAEIFKAYVYAGISKGCVGCIEDIMAQKLVNELLLIMEE